MTNQRTWHPIGRNVGNFKSLQPAQLEFDPPDEVTIVQKTDQVLGTGHVTERVPRIPAPRTTRSQAPVLAPEQIATDKPHKPKAASSAALRAAVKECEALRQRVGELEKSNAELDEKNGILSEELDRLEGRNRLHFMDGTAEEKAAVAERTAWLEKELRDTTYRVQIMTDSRDSYMRELAEIKQMCSHYRRRLQKLAKQGIAVPE